MSEVVFLTRRSCSICATALPMVEARARRRGHTLTVIDVDDADLADQYGDRVPVVLVEGVEVLAGLFGRRAVRSALR